jgi:hypothetical protein
MIKYLLDLLKNVKEQDKTQTTLNVLFGKTKKSDLIKIQLPKKYISMVELLAMYGVDDSIELLKILESNIIRSNQAER